MINSDYRQMQPLEVIARLQKSVGTGDGELPLDGPLAAEWMRRHHTDLYYNSTVGIKAEDLIDADLPLERRGNLSGPDWYFACSFAVWPDLVAEGQTHWNKRFRSEYSDMIDFAGKRGKVIVEQGPQKAYHMPLFYTAAMEVKWWVFGDKAGIEDLLSGIRAIGKKTSQGFGVVLDWEVAPMAEDWSCYRNGRPTRTIPVDENNPPPSGDFGYRGYRPPYWHPARQGFVLLPDKEALTWKN